MTDWVRECNSERRYRDKEYIIEEQMVIIIKRYDKTSWQLLPHFYFIKNVEEMIDYRKLQFVPLLKTYLGEDH